MSAGRHRLPHRRFGAAGRLAAGDVDLHVRANVDAGGQAREIFIRPRGRTDTDLNDTLDALAILASLLLQYGETPAALGRRFAAAQGPAARALAAGLAWAAGLERELAGSESR